MSEDLLVDKILDNRKNGKVGETLQALISKGSKLSFISSCFTIYAYQKLKTELQKCDHLKFLFIEPTFIKNKPSESREYYIGRTERERNLSGSAFELRLKNDLNQSSIARECAKWIQEKTEMRSLVDTSVASVKLYHIEDAQGRQVAIQGNSDFTAEGLGFTPSTRMNVNSLTSNQETTNGLLSFFDEIWNNSQLVEDVKEEVLSRVLSLYKENSPEFIYFVTLYNIFKDYLEELDEDSIVKSRTGFKNTIVWNRLYKFQRDGVLGAIDKLERHNGCIIADSVGLGKTFEALAVIKYYELRNCRVLVLAPKKLRENWTVYTINDKRNILADDRFGYDVLNHTDLSRYNGFSGEINLETLNWSNYDLIVIDESHNFRNNDPRKDRETRYSRLMNQIIKQGVRTKVLMLSATPVNNRMTDLKNQVAFITEGNDVALNEYGITSIEQTLRQSQAIFNRWSKLPTQQRKLDTFLEMVNFDYFKLLDTITIARSRKHIEKYYNIQEVGKFPDRRKPFNIKADIDLKSLFPSLEDVNKTIRRLTLGAYSPLKYVRMDKQEEYSERYDMYVQEGRSRFRQIDRETNLIHLMRVNLLKRMESSIYSFGITINNVLKQINILLEKIERGDDYIDESLDIRDVDLEDEELEDKLIGNKVKVLLQDIDLVKWKQDLDYDKRLLEQLLNEAEAISANRDAKLDELKKLISHKINNPINGTNKKILIFSAFADTANYLYENLADWVQKEFGLYSALVTGSGSNKSTLPIKQKDLGTILTYFSPLSKEKHSIYPDDGLNIDILIGTDCISEGQNLQDCDYLVNYDIHWNPVRIIQRFGRIDRIGSCNDSVQLVNFWPNMELDEYINLEARVTGRMVLLDVSATGDENIIDSEKQQMNDLEYRRNQLKQLQEDVVDLEEMSGGVSITDLTFNDFRMDLVEYMRTNKSIIEKSACGMYAITPVSSESESVIPGVIFCLRHISRGNVPDEHNAFYPYYMVYVKQDGAILNSFVATKKILDMYKKLCFGNSDVLSDLVCLFNEETEDGRNMNEYSTLLENAIANIIGKKDEKGIESLFTKGGTTILNNNYQGKDDFELISFLIIK
ncbi:MAG: DEAD/DEAH box helicase family protein [Candidatus Omnitrophica bacterium]|nr:DEAD/DEAH box helicase family protein [Candidatus Omnitrophota bacterium]